MLITLLCISLLILITGIYGCFCQQDCYPPKNIFQKFKRACYYNEDIYFILNTIGATLLSVTFLAILIVGILYSNIKVIDKKIELYTTENQQIEESIDNIVRNYQNYEQNTFEKCKTDPTFVLTMYPELKSNELVKSQAELYVNNNKQIKNLKSKKLDYEVLGWWLFFK